MHYYFIQPFQVKKLFIKVRLMQMSVNAGYRITTDDEDDIYFLNGSNNNKSIWQL